MKRAGKTKLQTVSAKYVGLDRWRAEDSVGLGLLFSFFVAMLIGAGCLVFFLFEGRAEVLRWLVSLGLAAITIGLAALRLPYTAVGMWLGLVIGVGMLGLLLIGLCGALLVLIPSGH